MVVLPLCHYSGLSERSSGPGMASAAIEIGATDRVVALVADTQSSAEAEVYSAGSFAVGNLDSSVRRVDFAMDTYVETDSFVRRVGFSGLFLCQRVGKVPIFVQLELEIVCEDAQCIIQISETFSFE